MECQLGQALRGAGRLALIQGATDRFMAVRTLGGSYLPIKRFSDRVVGKSKRAWSYLVNEMCFRRSQNKCLRNLGGKVQDLSEKFHVKLATDDGGDAKNSGHLPAQMCNALLDRRKDAGRKQIMRQSIEAPILILPDERTRFRPRS
jgi:hypothetical protein